VPIRVTNVQHRLQTCGALNHLAGESPWEEWVIHW
jgi:hypothetical protein